MPAEVTPSSGSPHNFTPENSIDVGYVTVEGKTFKVTLFEVDDSNTPVTLTGKKVDAHARSLIEAYANDLQKKSALPSETTFDLKAPETALGTQELEEETKASLKSTSVSSAHTVSDLWNRATKLFDDDSSPTPKGGDSDSLEGSLPPAPTGGSGYTPQPRPVAGTSHTEDPLAPEEAEPESHGPMQYGVSGRMRISRRPQGAPGSLGREASGAPLQAPGAAEPESHGHVQYGVSGRIRISRRPHDASGSLGREASGAPSHAPDPIASPGVRPGIGPLLTGGTEEAGGMRTDHTEELAGIQRDIGSLRAQIGALSTPPGTGDLEDAIHAIESRLARLEEGLSLAEEEDDGEAAAPSTPRTTGSVVAELREEIRRLQEAQRGRTESPHTPRIFGSHFAAIGTGEAPLQRTRLQKALSHLPHPENPITPSEAYDTALRAYRERKFEPFYYPRGRAGNLDESLETPPDAATLTGQNIHLRQGIAALRRTAFAQALIEKLRANQALDEDERALIDRLHTLKNHWLMSSKRDEEPTPEEIGFVALQYGSQERRKEALKTIIRHGRD